VKGRISGNSRGPLSEIDLDPFGPASARAAAADPSFCQPRRPMSSASIFERFELLGWRHSTLSDQEYSFPPSGNGVSDSNDSAHLWSCEYATSKTSDAEDAIPEANVSVPAADR